MEGGVCGAWKRYSFPEKNHKRSSWGVGVAWNEQLRRVCCYKKIIHFERGTTKGGCVAIKRHFYEPLNDKGNGWVVLLRGMNSWGVCVAIKRYLYGAWNDKGNGQGVCVVIKRHSFNARNEKGNSWCACIGCKRDPLKELNNKGNEMASGVSGACEKSIIWSVGWQRAWVRRYCCASGWVQKTCSG